MATAVQPDRPAEPCRWPTRDQVEERLRDARRAVTAVRHTAEDAAANAVSKVRRHPLRAVGGAMAAGALAGAFVGACAAWFKRPRRRWEW